jgi:hypothetical protein
MSPAFDPLPAAQNRRWVHYVNDDFFDQPDLDSLLERLLFRLERFARDKPWCHTTNHELMRQLDCSKNTLADLLKRGEALGWFRRVLIPGRHGHPTARLGFVLFRRPTDRPVATDKTFDLVVALMTAEIRRTNPHPRTVPFGAEATERTGGGTQKLGTPVPKIWGAAVPKNWGPSYKEKDTGEETQKTTMTRSAGGATPIGIHAPSESSSSSFASLPSNRQPEPTPPPATGSSASLPSPIIPAADASIQPIISPVGPAVPQPSPVARVEPVAVPHSPVVVPSSPAVVHPRVGTVEVTPTVPARALGLTTEGLDQALLMALVARVVRLSSGFKVGANWTPQQARDAILGLLRSLGCPLWWISNALDQAERHPRAKVGNKPVESWGFIRQVVSNWSHGDGTPGSPPVSKAGSPPGVPSPGGPSRDGKPSRPPPASADVAIDADLRELSGEQLRESIAELEASLSQLESARRSRMWEFLRTKLSQARSEQSARGGGP